MAMVKLHAPETHTSCSFDGDEYQVEEGMVTVPQKAVAHLVSHGFSTTKPELVTAPPVGIVDMQTHEATKSDLAAAEQLIKEQEGQLAALRADLAKKAKP